VIVDYRSATRETRYRLLETIREYAHEKLIETGEEHAVRDRHMEFFTKLARAAERKLLSAEQVIWPNRLETELDNLRAAIEWSLKSKNPDSAMSIVGTSGPFWSQRGHYREITERSLHVVRSPMSKQHTSARAKALNIAGFMQAIHGNYAEAHLLLEEALAIARELTDKLATLTSLQYLGFVSAAEGDYATARSYFEEALAQERELGPTGTASKGWSLAFLGDVFFFQGDYERAQSLYEQAVTYLRELNEKNILAYSIRRLGQLALLHADYEKAIAFNKESLSLNLQVGEQRGVVACLAGFAGIAAARGQSVPAVRLLGAVESFLGTISVPQLPTDQLAYDHNVAALRAQLDEAAFNAAWVEGRVMSMEQAVAYALEQAKRLEVSV
jgi:non-specific serine/threonine protein kinase